MSTKQMMSLIISGIVGIALLILCFTLMSIETVKGNEMGVLETWVGGVQAEPLHPRTYFLLPAWTQKIYHYDMSSQVFVMNDNHTATDDPKAKKLIKESYHGREMDAFKVQSAEGQDMWISLNVRWRLDPEKLVNIHTSVRTGIEDKLIRPVVMLVVKNEATRRSAVEAYSGESLVKLQTDIHNDLTNPANELRQRGIIVENFVIEGIKLNEKYIGEITARQVASQAKLRADEETKAANATALKAQAEAKADYNRRVVEAERDRQVGILKAEELAKKEVLAAEAAAKQVTLKAEADRQQVVLEAQGAKEAGVLRAHAIEALGKAEAEATKLKLSAYAAPGVDAFVRIETARHMSEGFKNIKGYLPSNMSTTILSENFLGTVDRVIQGMPQKK